MEISAHGKLNLTLDVLRRREDGYHDLRMIMQSVELCDTITLQPAAESGIQVTTNLSFLPADGRNLAAIAAERFRSAAGKGPEGLAIQIYKRIPVCAGMGGGSSDAAAVLRALNELTGAGLSPEELARLGQSVGSDVPYCVLGGTALAEGRGEVLTPLPPLPDCRIVLCKPRFSISTPELFSRICCGKIRCRPDTAGVIAALEAGDLTGVARRLYNVFEDVLPVRLAGEITAIKQTMQGCGALGAAMSGTGPTVFGLFARERGAEQAAELLRRTYSEVFLTRPYNLV
ncbi:4-diphosphocytidyl-2-C-methyl-D-erythritol kinase [bioreactor metagenome]|uniref:4-(cytidine 5'-diphospho)-2-C-methyl-D-erythritol kinase n=1 Tax=bioreactor metagenome TaxID=1076179 RepID=A0A645ALR1_9ZZZZ